MEKGIVADSVSFYIRHPSENDYQQVDEYDWLESEGKAYYRRLGARGVKLCAVTGNKYCHL